MAESLPVDEESVIESETSSVPTVTAAHEEVSSCFLLITSQIIHVFTLTHILLLFAPTEW